jgi:hypothetical protein
MFAEKKDHEKANAKYQQQQKIGDFTQRFQHIFP